MDVGVPAVVALVVVALVVVVDLEAEDCEVLGVVVCLHVAEAY